MEEVAGIMSNQQPFCLHPDNPRYFLFRGQPRVLVCATEHYGSVVNRAFDFERYLDDAADKGQTLTRLFLLFRELQTPRNPSSPCKPESPDYLAPWQRVGPGLALDGEPIYDLDRWDEDYFARLRRFLTLASARGIVVELTLFSNTYADEIWALNPLRAANNVNGVGNVEWQDYTSLTDPTLVERQQAYARRVVRETHAFDNVYYEVCNEPGGGHGGHVTPREVDAWQETIAATVRDEEVTLPYKHLIFWSQAFTYHPHWEQPLDVSFSNPAFDAVNVHPLPDTVYRGRRYMLGRFMGRDLALSEIRDFCLAASAEPKPCILDEDNSASMYRDDIGWTIHRKRAWTAVLSGCHYDYIDFAITVGRETGTEESRRKIRAWMGHLSAFIRDVDVVHARPTTDWIRIDTEEVIVTGLGIPGHAYAAYVADCREVGDSGLGRPLSPTVELDLPPGHYVVSIYSPVTGLHSPSVAVDGGHPYVVALVPFVHDVVIVAGQPQYLGERIR